MSDRFDSDASAVIPAIHRTDVIEGSHQGRHSTFRIPHSAFSLLLCALLFLLLAPSPIRAQEALPADFMPSSQVRPGMVGEGRTVFKGYKVEPFKVEILGVQHNNMAGSDMIVAKLSGQFLEKHGVVAGMSGSPVFINGKLIGAVAYGWSYAYAPYCGITPIEQMWTVWQSIGQPNLAEVHETGPTHVSADGGSYAWDWESAWKDYQQMLQGQKPGGGRETTSTGFRPQPARAGRRARRNAPDLVTDVYVRRLPCHRKIASRLFRQPGN